MFCKIILTFASIFNLIKFKKYIENITLIILYHIYYVIYNFHKYYNTLYTIIFVFNIRMSFNVDMLLI